MKVFVSSALAIAAALATAAPGARADLPASVTALIDASVDPCDDFYKYACGGWARANPLDAGEVSKDALFSVLTSRSEQVIKEVAEEDWPLVGEFWDSCRDTAAIETLGAKVLNSQFSKISAAGTRALLFRLAGELARSSDKSLGIQLRVGADPQDGKTAALVVDRAALTLPERAQYNQTGEWWTQHGAGFRKYIATVLKLSGFSPKPMSTGASLEVDPYVMADAVLSIEAKLASLEDSSVTPTTIALSPASARWTLSVGTFFVGAAVVEKTKLTSASGVVFRDTNYLDALEKTVAGLAVEDLKSYLAFKLIHDRIQYLSAPFVDAYTAFFVTELQGKPARSSRDGVCVENLKQLLPGLVGKHYASKAFGKDRAAGAQRLATQLTDAVAKRLATLDGLDDAARSEAQAKLGDVTILLGQSTVKRSYAFSLARDTLYTNVQAIRESEFTTKLSTIGGPVNRVPWSISPADVAPAYSPLGNKLMVPAAFVQEPLFNGELVHPAQTFGAVGALLGRELSHAFDATFAPRAQCLATQYSSFVATSSETGKPLATVNGSLTLAENVADNAGVALAWDAYQAYVATASLDTQAITQAEADKLFFLSNAQTWCSATRDSFLTESLRTSTYAPAEWRAKGVAINSKQFARTFNCSAGSRMNPVDKCQVW